MNNKGFIVSTILYSILIAFLLFLGVTLATFASATATVGAGTKDLVNSEKLTIKQLVPRCQDVDDIFAVVTSRYGELYWPKDFPSGENHNLKVTCLKNGIPCDINDIKANIINKDMNNAQFTLKVETVGTSYPEYDEIMYVPQCGA